MIVPQIADGIAGAPEWRPFGVRCVDSAALDRAKARCAMISNNLHVAAEPASG
jgi:hypothetical protein